MEMLKVQEVESRAAEGQKQIRNPGSFQTKFYSRDWLIKSIIY